MGKEPSESQIHSLPLSHSGNSIHGIIMQTLWWLSLRVANHHCMSFYLASCLFTFSVINILSGQCHETQRSLYFVYFLMEQFTCFSSNLCLALSRFLTNKQGHLPLPGNLLICLFQASSFTSNWWPRASLLPVRKISFHIVFGGHSCDSLFLTNINVLAYSNLAFHEFGPCYIHTWE